MPVMFQEDQTKPPISLPPENPFAPYAPDEKQPWTTRWAGHLLRRGAFGANAERLKMAREKGPAGTIEWLFAFDPATDVGGLNAFLDQAGSLFDIRRSPTYVVQWWFHRMIHTPAPLQEKLAVMWHDHFATGAGKVGRADWMHDQIELFRTGGLGSFRDLLVKVGRQPAMLRWLDGHGSHKSAPNENYGREIMELFSLGIGQYEEKDIQEVSRCFTGWLVDGSREAKFVEDRWDEGEKIIFEGKPFASKGPFNDEQAVDAILKHPEAPRYIARRLLSTFVHPEPLEEHIAHYGQRLLEHKWQIKPVLQEIFASRLFFSDWAYRSIIKSPVDLTVGGAIAVGGVPRADFLRQATALMGQSLLYPPDVSGWTGGKAWINANTVMTRFRFGNELALQGFNEFVSSPMYQELEERDIKTSPRLVNYFSDLLLDGDIPADARGQFLDYMNRDPNNQPSEFVFNYANVQAKGKGVVQLMMSIPHYQLA